MPILFFLLFFAAVAVGEPTSFLQGVRLPSTQELQQQSAYPHPTEHNQGESVSVVSNAPRGAYVSVGFERSFVGAAITPGADHLVILDVGQNIINYSRYNAGLLALARDRADYLHLRLKATNEEIAQRIEAKKAELPSDYAEALLDPTTSSHFHLSVRSTGSSQKFSVLQEPPPASGDFAYKDANYLYDDKLFAKLQGLAQKGRITALHCDLADKDAVNAVVNGLAEKKVGLSVLDVSDTWFYSRGNRPFSFLPPEKSVALWHAFEKVSQPNSVVLMTSWRNLYRKLPDPRPEVAEYWPWLYFGLDYRSLADKSRTEATLKQMLSYYEMTGNRAPA